MRKVAFVFLLLAIALPGIVYAKTALCVVDESEKYVSGNRTGEYDSSFRDTIAVQTAVNDAVNGMGISEFINSVVSVVSFDVISIGLGAIFAVLTVVGGVKAVNVR